jgi:hypothetical protein
MRKSVSFAGLSGPDRYEGPCLNCGEPIRETLFGGYFYHLDVYGAMLCPYPFVGKLAEPTPPKNPNPRLIGY